MKFYKKIILAFLASTISSYAGVFAAGIDHFEVKLEPTNVKVNESIDLTIEAVDKNNTTVLDYKGTILIFSESDPEAELPSALEENTYTFSAEDQGKIKFENSVKMKSAGVQNIYIYDLNDDTVFGLGEVTVSEDTAIINKNINIVSPGDGLTIGKDSFLVSGTTQKNYQVKIIVNGKEELTTTSNDDGIFEKEITNLESGDTTIKAQVLDADLKVIGESDEVVLKVELSNLNIKNVKLTPESVEPEDSLEITVTANSKLTSVSVVIDDVLTELKETTDGVYVSKIIAPKEAGVYSVDVNLQDELGHKKTELGAASLTVKETPLNVAEEKNNEPTVTTTTNTGSAEKIDRELKITGLKLVELKNRSILTWDEIENVDSYNIYKKISDGKLELIVNVKTPRFEVEVMGDETKYDYFAVKAVAKTASGELYEGSLSDATKIKTGPEIIILLVLSLLIGGFFFVRRQQKA